MLDSAGFFLRPLALPEGIRERVVLRDWLGLDQAMRRETLPGGVVFEELRKVRDFSEIEFIISIRSSLEEPDEDGIWHDDGSRFLAFSLSLTLDAAAVEGGRLEIRRRFEDAAPIESLVTPPYGTMIVFATGHQGFEHKINRVAGGERIVIAGWCSGEART